MSGLCSRHQIYDKNCEICNAEVKMTYNCPKCKKEFSQIPDNLHFHFWCKKCDKEYKLDGVTEWEEK